MGVRFHPGDASWSYGGFADFRRRLASAEGINLLHMQGFGGHEPWELPNGTPRTALAPFLNHSDCEGYLDGYDCASVWPRLHEIIGGWPADEYDSRNGYELIKAMRHCAEHGCALVFS